jgi:CheY-like chemotaxis protein
VVEQRTKKTVLLMADDDEDDCLLMREAVREVFQSDHFHCVGDGQELMDYLFRRGIYTDHETYPLPDLILLDLNMPRKDGLQALEEIKEHPLLKAIPILIFSTSKEQKEIDLCYSLGANSYITKPVSFESLVKVVRCLSDYWFGIVGLPLSERLRACIECEAQQPAKCTR